MQNIELKVSMKDFRPIIKLLKKNKVKKIGELIQNDTYYSITRGQLKIREINGEIFELIYYERPKNKDPKVSNYQIIRLTKKQAVNFKKNIEKILTKKSVVNKKRQLWLFGHTRIHLDNIRKIGKFLELETVLKNINFRKGKKEHHKIIKILDLSKYKKINKSYGDFTKDMVKFK